MNPLHTLESPISNQNKSNSKINIQAQEIFELITKAITSEKEFVVYSEYVYPENRVILQNKGFIVAGTKIIWGSYKPLLGL